MQKVIRKFTRSGCAVVIGMVVGYWQVARAGYSVNVNISSGRGTVTARVIHTNTTTTPFILTTNVITSGFMTSPGVAINRQSNSFPAGSLHSDLGFAVTGALPAGTDPRTYVQIRASSNNWASAQTDHGPSDFGDSPNADLLPFIIPRSACASSQVEIVPIQTTANSIKFQFKAKLSDEGSAVLLQIVETNSTTGLAKQKYVVLLVGPYDNTADACEGTVTVNGDVENMALLLDESTATLPFNITCPTDQVLSCSAPLPATYDPAAEATGGVAPVTITYDKLPADLVIGNNVVTATARDANGCTVSCQFNVNRQGITFTGFDPPIGTDFTFIPTGTAADCQVPFHTYRLGNVVPLKFAMTCNGVPVTSGVPTVRIDKCGGGFFYNGVFQLANDEWHFQIDSSVIGTTPPFAGKYLITATLPDGSKHSTLIQYRR